MSDPQPSPRRLPETDVERATDVLMIAFGVDAETAHEMLAWAAADPPGTDLATTASRFLDGAATIVFDRSPPTG